MDWSLATVNVAEMTGQLHPIDVLVADARSRFSALINKQSKSVQQATDEYKRRYKRDPPPHFEGWFSLCQENGVTLIDEFDGIMQSLQPLWGIPPRELRYRVQEAFLAPSIAKITVQKNHSVHDYEDFQWFSPELIDMISIGVDILPEMDLALNTLDEPRVVVPSDMLHRLLRQSSQAEYTEIVANPSLIFLDIAQQKNWDYIILSCPVDSPSRSSPPHNEANPNLSFILNHTKASDICIHPQYRDKHGIFLSPASLSLTNTLVPIFSQGKPSTFQDLLYPSPYYIATWDGYDSTTDGPWSEKREGLYWAGSSTGGEANHHSWESLHRHRFVSHVNGTDNPVLLMNETSPDHGNWTTYPSTMSTVSHLFDVKFTTLYDCSDPACDAALKAKFRVAEHEDVSMSYSSKLVIDVDGNGFSGRYYRLLRSNSAVLKQTLIREWHDDWLAPWVHFIPISMGMEELPEVVRYLSLDPRGQAVSEAIATQGRDWANRSLRPVDMKLVLVRILMEYGRLLSDERDTLRCCDTG